MLTENDVVIAIVKFLKNEGYTIHHALTTSQQGIDIEATSGVGKPCFVEAKGATSSKIDSKRYGKEFNSNQVKTHVGMALLKSFQTLQLFPKAEVVIGLPNNESHRHLIDSMRIPIQLSGIKVIFVDIDGTVSKNVW